MSDLGQDRSRLGLARVTFTEVGIERLQKLLAAAVTTDGDHHKQWYLEQIAEFIDLELPDHEPGIAP